MLCRHSADRLDIVQDIWAKLKFLSNASPGILPANPNAVIVFGSPRVEVPAKLIDLLGRIPATVPIFISGKGKAEAIDQRGGQTEAEYYRGLLLRAGISARRIHLDTAAASTAENARNLVGLLGQYGIPLRELIYVNFCVMSRSGQNALRDLGVTDIFSVSADFLVGAGLFTDDILIQNQGWIEFHYNKAGGQ